MKFVIAHVFSTYKVFMSVVPSLSAAFVFT